MHSEGPSECKLLQVPLAYNSLLESACAAVSHTPRPQAIQPQSCKSCLSNCTAGTAASELDSRRVSAVALHAGATVRWVSALLMATVHRIRQAPTGSFWGCCRCLTLPVTTQQKQSGGASTWASEVSSPPRLGFIRVDQCLEHQVAKVQAKLPLGRLWKLPV